MVVITEPVDLCGARGTGFRNLDGNGFDQWICNNMCVSEAKVWAAPCNVEQTQIIKSSFIEQLSEGVEPVNVDGSLDQRLLWSNRRRVKISKSTKIDM